MKGIKRLLVLQHLEIEGPGLFKQFAEERDYLTSSALLKYCGIN